MNSNSAVGTVTSDAPDMASVSAVLAHTLLNSLAVVRGGAELLARHHEGLDDLDRRTWYRRIDAHSRHLAAVLERMAQGRLAEALVLCETSAPGATVP